MEREVEGVFEPGEGDLVKRADAVDEVDEVGCDIGLEDDLGAPPPDVGHIERSQPGASEARLGGFDREKRDSIVEIRGGERLVAR